MNYLAHLYLAGDQPGLVIGGFLADFVKGPLKGHYPADIEQGMRLHRKIDVWSDEHGALDLFRKSLPAEFRRYSGIIADVLGDHFLSCYWIRHSEEGLGTFAQRQIKTLQTQKEIYPEKARWVLDRMTAGQWLTSYQDVDYCLSALDYIGQRLKRENPLHKLEQPVKDNYQQLSELCGEILADLKTNVAEWRAAQAS